MSKLMLYGALGTVCLIGVLLTGKWPTLPQKCSTIPECETEARSYLQQVYEKEYIEVCNKAGNAEWGYVTNLTNAEAGHAAYLANREYADFQYRSWNESIRHWKHEQFTDPLLKRQLKLLNVIGNSALNSRDVDRLSNVLGKMSNKYGTAKICPFTKQTCNLTEDGLNLEPEIEAIIATSRNSTELAYVWKAWRDASGKPIRNLYDEFIDLSNRAAKANGFEETSGLWLFRYESDNFKVQMENVWNGVKGVYQKLYGFVRHRLRGQYPNDFANEDDPIPAHILGNMWSQRWGKIYEFVKPFPSAPGFDVTAKLQEV